MDGVSVQGAVALMLKGHQDYPSLPLSQASAAATRAFNTPLGPQDCHTWRRPVPLVHKWHRDRTPTCLRVKLAQR